MVGMAAMAAIQQKTLILTSSLTSVHQWQRELLDKTTLSADQIAEYSGQHKATGPVTLATFTKSSPTGPARMTIFCTWGYLISNPGG